MGFYFLLLSGSPAVTGKRVLKWFGLESFLMALSRLSVLILIGTFLISAGFSSTFAVSARWIARETLDCWDYSKTHVLLT